MGSATTQAREVGAAALASATVDLDTARELFAAARATGDSQALSGALADKAADPAARAALVATVFASLSPVTRELLTTIAAQRWSSAADLTDGIEELAIRATAKAEVADVEGELFQVTRVISQNPDLELTLGSHLGDQSKKAELLRQILGTHVGAGALLIATSIVEQAGKRRVRRAFQRAIALVAAQRAQQVATVYTATRLTPAQRDRLAASLARTYGSAVSINEVVDPAVVGGIRVQIADDVIDGSISTRLGELRSRLAG
ncbi:F0F1 ATP synthase subunit delta [Microbacterium amylolyticum]|uniref:ATP synthase subunit delta n=1 Tax=Microbacterium amylolyticum TaxID=936337 RepID=A0ABS4ZG28_9MICO|nr:F0F1 ATP synthase subunit delta [Microbacterium amylolyticum]MBP2436241.1 F-type H+-transporting ATPase subunit delta [Microbacterium amylolyticum]